MADLTFNDVVDYVEQNHCATLNLAFSASLPVSLVAAKAQIIEFGYSEAEGCELGKLDIELQHDEVGEFELLHGRKTPEIVQDVFTDGTEEIWQDVPTEDTSSIVNYQNLFGDTE